MEGRTTAHGTAVTLVVMYEDESVEVHCANGTQLQLSPCGCEFTVVRATEPSSHPLQRKERIRQRTRFTISTHKEILKNALTFRNKHASQPYLPKELIPACHIKLYYSINLDVKWPESSCCGVERGPGGEIIIRSEEGQATLMLSPSGEEFSVEFICNLSQGQSKLHSVEGVSCKPQGSSGGQQHESKPISEAAGDKTREVHQGDGGRKGDSKTSRFGSPKITGACQPKPESEYQSTTVVQHHSCRSPNPLWSYPLSLARHVWSTCLSKAVDGSAETDQVAPQRKADEPQTTVAEGQSGLPQALPLTCSSPHWHRWRVNDGLDQKQHLDKVLSTELVKVMWSNGITYRILSAAVPVVEISPGDGSVIRSDGILSTYFTHHKPDVTSGQVREVTYHLHNLPPDVPGQPYSIASVLRQASRLLSCYNETKQSVRLAATPNCLKEVGYLCELKTSENPCSPASVEPQMSITKTSDSRSDLVAAELEKIKRLNFLFDQHNLCDDKVRDEGMKKSAGVECGSEGGGATEAISEDVIAEALRRTSRAVQDIETITSAVTMT